MAKPTLSLGAVILAGGESRRMGRDKAWLELEDRPLVARALTRIREAGITEVFISGRAGVDYSAFGCRVLLDQAPGIGPLGGIQRGLEEVKSHMLLVLAVDLPRMTAEFLRGLAGQCDRLTGAVPELNGKLEPLAAIYPERCRAILRDCLAKQKRSARGFAQACWREGVVRKSPVSELDAVCFENWNTPLDVTARPVKRAASPGF